VDKESKDGAPVHYRLQVQERLGPEWRAWFGDLAVTAGKGGGSQLSGPVADQAALHSLIRKLRDLGLTLVSLQRLDQPHEKGDSA
jgi:hypothetical protein